MQDIYENMTVHGSFAAKSIAGALSEETRAPIENRIDKLVKALQDEFAQYKEEAERREQEHTEQISELISAVASLKEVNELLAKNYNKAIEVINDLSGRVAALEKNYDPTVI